MAAHLTGIPPRCSFHGSPAILNLVMMPCEGLKYCGCCYSLDDKKFTNIDAFQVRHPDSADALEGFNIILIEANLSHRRKADVLDFFKELGTMVGF